MKEFVEYMVAYGKFNHFREGKSNGYYNGIKILTGSDGENLIYKRMTYVINLLWPSPLGLRPTLKRQEMWMVN